ncbi:MAG: hypothetical protein JOZ54_16640 [Acidobacteria bacterium]|nr:hypothetical protein [Acidobacteriota bacterium]
MHIEEQRTTERYIAVETIDGSFGAASVTVLDLGVAGAQVAHAQPLRLGTSGRLLFRRGAVQVAVPAKIVWSHLSRTPNAEGKLLYQSGLRIDDGEDFSSAVQTLRDDGVVRRDLDSLQRKRRRLEEKEQEKQGKPAMKVVHQDDIPADQQLLVEHARNRLRATGSDDAHAVFEYLEHTVELNTILKIFDRKG